MLGLRAWGGGGAGPVGPGRGRRRGGARGVATERGKGLGTPWAGPGGVCVGKGGGVDGRHPAGPAPAAPKLEAMNNLLPNLVVTANYCKLPHHCNIITTNYCVITAELRLHYYRLLLNYHTITSTLHRYYYIVLDHYFAITTSLLHITTALLRQYPLLLR